jgi:SAM-dependent methyltransferase
VTRPVPVRSRLALRALTAATRWRARGWPWSSVANVIAAGAAGALSPGELRQGVADAWELWDPADVGNFELMAWERFLIERIARPNGRLLIVGSGLGRDLVAYARLGYSVTGIEPAPVAARISSETLREQGLAGTVLNGFAEDVAIDGTFDTVIFSYFSYAYIPCAGRRIALLRKLHPHAGRAGAIVITYNPRRRFSLTPLTKVTAWLSGSEWRPESGDTVYLTGRVAAPFAVERLFTDADIVAEAAAAGYRVTFQEPVGEVRLATLQAGGDSA